MSMRTSSKGGSSDGDPVCCSHRARRAGGAWIKMELKQSRWGNEWLKLRVIGVNLRLGFDRLV